MSANEKKRAPNPANPTLLRRGAAVLGLLPVELELVLAYRPIRLRAERLPSYDFGCGETIGFGPPDAPAPPRSSQIEARPGWREVLAEQLRTYKLADLEVLVERLPMRAAAVIGAMAALPPNPPDAATKDDLKSVAAFMMPVRRMHITFAVLCAAVDMLGSLLYSVHGLPHRPHNTYDILLKAPEFTLYKRLRRLLWRAMHPKEYTESVAKSSAKWNRSGRGKACKREYMRSRRLDPQFAEAERARRRQTYAAKKTGARPGQST
jgi:hypothetical protein